MSPKRPYPLNMTSLARNTPLSATFDNIEGLDGLRAVAVTIVLIAHFGFYKFVPGGFGVTLFFFISGLLITRLLLAEATAKGRINVPYFYIRRALRLYPALLASIVVGCAVFMAVGGTVTIGEVMASLFYYANYYSIYVGYNAHMPANVEMHPFGVLWSLAVEEQYYLVFPALFVLMKADKDRLMRFILPVLVSCLVWRGWLVFAEHVVETRTYGGTDTRIDSILYGALTTCILAGAKGERFLAFCSRTTTLVAAFAVLLFCFLYRDVQFRETARYTLQGLALMPIVTSTCFSPRFGGLRRILESAPFRLMGAWSYSLYLFHPIAIIVAEYYTQVNYLSGPAQIPLVWYCVAIPLTFALSTFSYYFVEGPAVRLRRHFGSHR